MKATGDVKHNKKKVLIISGGKREQRTGNVAITIYVEIKNKKTI